VIPNVVGLNTSGTQSSYQDSTGATISWGNGRDGIRVDGKAQDIRIAGNKRSLIPQNSISNNSGYGIHILGQARNILVNNAYIGLNSIGGKGFGNILGGLYAGEDVQQLQIGNRLKRNLGTRGTNRFGNQISSNTGNGITLNGLTGVQILGNLLKLNSGSGVEIIGGSNNTIISNTANGNGLYGFELNNTENIRLSRNKGSNNGSGLYS